MPAAEVELDDRDESFDGVLDLGDGEEHLGVAHETNESNSQQKRTFRALRHKIELYVCPYLVIRSSMLRGSRMKVGRTTLLRSAPGRSWEMMCDRTTRWSAGASLVAVFLRQRTVALVGLDHQSVILGDLGLGPITRGSAA